jgi:hypothetical protein
MDKKYAFKTTTIGWIVRNVKMVPITQLMTTPGSLLPWDLSQVPPLQVSLLTPLLRCVNIPVTEFDRV